MSGKVPGRGWKPEKVPPSAASDSMLCMAVDNMVPCCYHRRQGENQVKTIEVKTTHELVFRIKVDTRADNCFSCAFPDRFAPSVQDALKFRDELETLADGTVIWYAGSLSRMLEFIAEYIGQSEL